MTSLLKCSLCFSDPSSPQTREQEELEELLLLEQQGNEQRRLQALQEEQRQLNTKRKNKQALLDELVRNARCMYICIQMMQKHTSPYVRCFMCNTHINKHTLCLKAHSCEIIKSLLPVIVLPAALFSFCDSKASWLYCVELLALEVIVPAEWAAEEPLQITG